MGDKHGFTDEDWRVLDDAPLQVGATVLAVGPHGIKTTIHEVKAAKALVKHPGTYGAADDLIAAIAHEADRSKARLDTKRHLHAKPEKVAETLLAEVARVPAVLAQRSADEAAGVGAWLVDIADAVIGSSNEPTEDERTMRDRVAALFA